MLGIHTELHLRLDGRSPLNNSSNEMLSKIGRVASVQCGDTGRISAVVVAFPFFINMVDGGILRRKSVWQLSRTRSRRRRFFSRMLDAVTRAIHVGPRVLVRSSGRGG